MPVLGSLAVYAVATAQLGGSALFTIKWTGSEPTEAGWSPPLSAFLEAGAPTDWVVHPRSRHSYASINVQHGVRLTS
jgi:hypothetical protein